MSRKLQDLHPDLEPKTRAFLAECERQGIDILITCTHRSNDEQAALYAQGRSIPGKIVTNAKPGESAHNFTSPEGKPCSKAFDVVPIVHGKPEWNENNPVWQIVGQIGKSLGLEWAGDWKSFREFPHFELTR